MRKMFPSGLERRPSLVLEIYELQSSTHEQHVQHFSQGSRAVLLLLLHHDFSCFLVGVGNTSLLVFESKENLAFSLYFAAFDWNLFTLILKRYIEK